MEIEHLNKKKMLSDLDREKEEIGVKLYEKQQSLVELQRILESLHENQKVIIESRDQNERVLHQLEIELKEKVSESGDLNSQLLKRIEELSKQNMTIKEIETYNEELDSQIKVRKRVTYKIEEDMADKERLKSRQDYLIYTLMEEQKRVKQQRDVIEVQLKMQRIELEEARQALREAEDEISKIILTKQTLMSHLQKTTLNFNEKNKIVVELKEVLEREGEINLKKENEIKGLEAEIRRESSLHSKWLTLADKLEKELAVLDSVRAKMVEKINKAQEKHEMLKKACLTAEDDIKLLRKKETAARYDMNAIEGNIMKYHTEIKEKAEEALRFVSDHKTQEKLRANVVKQIREFELKNQEKLMEVEGLENEIARIRLDILNTENQLIVLDETRGALDKERLEKEKLINKYENIIRENHDAHEKKMHEVAKYNREHDKAKQKMDLIDRGPSELTLLQLNKEIETFRKERKRLEGEFIRQQTRAVNKEIQANKLQDDISTLKRKEIVLEQKKLRLANQYETILKEIKELEISLKNYEKDMNKLNDFLAQFNEKATGLKDKSNNINSEFLEKLNQLEKESARIEVEIEKLKTGKADILENITECERQILLWERKIELEREMQETLDPNVGRQELQEIKKELHLKQLKLNDLTKMHEKIILEIERVVEKRENINVKYNAKEIYSKINTDDVFSIKKDNTVVKSQVSKNIQLFKSSIKQSHQNINSINKEIEKLSAKTSEQKATLREAEERLFDEREELQRATQFIQNYKVKKIISVLDVFSRQQKAATLESIIKKGKIVKGRKLTQASLADKLEKNQKFLQAFKNVIGGAGELGYLNPFLQEIEEYLR